MKEPALEAVSETLLGARAYRALWNDIVRGRIEAGAAPNVVPVEGVTVTLEAEAPEEGKEFYKKVGISFSTGEFEFIGVPPGRYRISISDAQISLLGYRTDQASRIFEVVSKPDGDEIDNVSFMLIR